MASEIFGVGRRQDPEPWESPALALGLTPRQRGKMTMRMNCLRCATPLPAEVRFCGHCGMAVIVSGSASVAENSNNFLIPALSRQYLAPDFFEKSFNYLDYWGLAVRVAKGEYPAYSMIPVLPLAPQIAILFPTLIGFGQAVSWVYPLGLILFPVGVMALFCLLSLIYWLPLRLLTPVRWRDFHPLFVFQLAPAIVLILPYKWAWVLFVLFWISWGNYLQLLSLAWVHHLDIRRSLFILFLANAALVGLGGCGYFLFNSISS